MIARDTPRRRLIGYALVATAAGSWGLWPFILRRAEAFGPLPPALECVIVMAIATAVTLPLALRDRIPVGVRVRGPRDWALLATLGVTDALNILLFFAAYRATSVAVAVLTHYLTPIFVALAAPLVLRERATARTFIAVSLAFGGLVLLLEPWSASPRATDLLGAALGAGSAVFYASNVLLQKRLVAAFSGSEIMGLHGLVSVPLLAMAVPAGAWASMDTRALPYIVGGALGPGALASLAFVWGLRRVPASHASTLTLLEPFVAVVAASLLLGEVLRPLGVVGGVAILTGAMLVVLERRPAAVAVT